MNEYTCSGGAKSASAPFIHVVTARRSWQVGSSGKKKSAMLFRNRFPVCLFRKHKSKQELWKTLQWKTMNMTAQSDTICEIITTHYIILN